MARTVPETWVNAVITFTIPMDVSPHASHYEKLDAAVALFEDRFPDQADDCTGTVGHETVTG